MEIEHCSGAGATLQFTTKNYGITTCPSKEWNIVLRKTDCPPEDMREGRLIPVVDDLLDSKMSREAKLLRSEINAIVLYSGPMVRKINA